MTVSELIRELEKYPANMTVRIESSERETAYVFHDGIARLNKIRGYPLNPLFVLIETKNDDPDREIV